MGGYTDCAQTFPLPAGAKYYLDCQRTPLGSYTGHFADCNSVHEHEGQNCFNVDKGHIVPSGKCTGDWVSKTYAGSTCCGPLDDSETSRSGMTIPPAPSSCSAFHNDESYMSKCPDDTARTLNAVIL